MGATSCGQTKPRRPIVMATVTMVTRRDGRGANNGKKNREKTTNQHKHTSNKLNSSRVIQNINDFYNEETGCQQNSK